MKAVLYEGFGKICGVKAKAISDSRVKKILKKKRLKEYKKFKKKIMDNYYKSMLFLILFMLIFAIRFESLSFLNVSGGLSLGTALFYFKQVYNEYKLYKKLIGK